MIFLEQKTNNFKTIFILNYFLQVVATFVIEFGFGLKAISSSQLSHFADDAFLDQKECEVEHLRDTFHPLGLISLNVGVHYKKDFEDYYHRV